MQRDRIRVVMGSNVSLGVFSGCFRTAQVAYVTARISFNVFSNEFKYMEEISCILKPFIPTIKTFILPTSTISPLLDSN